MQLELFQFIEDTLNLFELKMPSYEYAEGQLEKTFSEIYADKTEAALSFHSRIKSSASLREKLIRNEFYLNCHSGEEALDHLSDLIGITVQCRFIRNEAELYQYLFSYFTDQGEDYLQCVRNENIYLNLRTAQPQTQRNGFTIYRIDGYYLFNNSRINFELQIKSLVHAFWNEIEHEVVYKNPDFVMYDAFNKNMLAAIRDNLDVVDRQLEIMYKEISYQSQQAQIGMDEKGFKSFVASSINELVNRKMKESLGFATDFKQCSAILAQYIYIREFINGSHNAEKMIDYLETLNYLSSSEIDFKEEIQFESPYESDDPFCSVFGKYLESRINTDFKWHVFFCMLFTIQPGNNLEDFTDFINVIRLLLVQPGWYEERFVSYQDKGSDVRNELLHSLAEELVNIGGIRIIHEEKVYELMQMFRTFCLETEKQYPSYEDYEKERDAILASLSDKISIVFH